MTATAFTQAQITRAVTGVRKAGLPIGAVEVTPDGSIRILTTAETESRPADPREPEPWPIE